MSQHIVPIKVYLLVFIALMVLLGSTIGASFLDLGPFNAVTALVIAGLKALLIILYFMHVRYSHSRLPWVFAGAGFFWLLILIVLAISDYLSRSWLAFSPPG